MPSGLTPEDQARWQRNIALLQRWVDSGSAVKQFPAGRVPAWALERFCREVVGFYDGAALEDVGGLLWDFIEEGPK